MNINEFYDNLINLIQNMVDKSFLKPIKRNMMLIRNDIEELLNMMRHYKTPKLEKRIFTREDLAIF